jgi:nucleoid-associated protein YgaU
MAKEEKKEGKKGLFGKAFDALSSKDEKEEIEKLQKELAEAKEAAAQADAKQKTATTQSRFAAQQAVKSAEARAAAAEAKLKLMEEELAKKKQQEALEARQAGDFDRKDFTRVSKEPEYLAQHTIAADETLSHIALKYYGHATRDYWMVIYEANKSTIGDNPGIVRPGMELNIPELPANLKD